MLPVNVRFNEDAILWIRFKVFPTQSRVVFAPAVEINTRTRKSCTFSHIHENIGQKTPLFVPHYGIIKQTGNLNTYQNKLKVFYQSANLVNKISDIFMEFIVTREEWFYMISGIFSSAFFVVSCLFFVSSFPDWNNMVKISIWFYFVLAIA